MSVGPNRLAICRWTVAMTFVSLAMPAAMVGQSRLIEGRARIDATSFDRIRVELDYVVEVVGGELGRAESSNSPGDTSIPLEGIAFRPSELESGRTPGAP